ncbi:YgfZ/GcvT domain-containing protein [Vulgatibacter incomptus]|uniref:Folate-dependent protein for Fe/S cluster synthesis/repair in oxidative stress n=1 Tax=Vulgatibacter incomptus TaxID=1391653 RepID=A0A0K1P8B8_9BACT|nr:folate-binding protein YgfZ [Vulgatibacter incomptus]AKU89768.1 Folate-dependent protein for Fe/S cluster synthesis/repair in oxidative stress [Vulgatibacter incomptus]
MARILPLHSSHVSAGARLGMRDDAEIVLSFREASREWSSLTESAGVADRSHRAVLRVTGPEAKLFLHGLVTNQVKAVEAGQGNYTAIINARGKTLGDGRMLVVGKEELLLDLEPESREKVLSHLDQLLISEDCELHDVTDRWAILGVYGPESARVVADALGSAIPSLPLHHHVAVPFEGGEVRVVAAAPAGVAGLDFFVERSVVEPLWNRLLGAASRHGGGPIGDEILDAARIHHAIPRYGAELDESTIPLEVNLERAISYTKGCYVGQEVIAKATYRGQVRRKLVQLRVPHGAAPGASLLEGEKVAGALVSVLDPDPAGGGPLALGFVRPDRLELGARLAIEGGGEAEISWVPPPRE